MIIFKAKPEHLRASGVYRVKRKFAWSFTQLNNGNIIWLRFYYSHELCTNPDYGYWEYNRTLKKFNP